MASLKAAMEEGEVDEFKTLLQLHKYSVNSFRYGDKGIPLTLLHMACQSGLLNVVRVLVSEFKAEVNIRALFGITPLHYACERGHADVAKALILEFNADLSMGNHFKETPLMLAARNGHEDVVVTLLCDCQCPVTGIDCRGWGVLHHACAGGSVAIARTLIDDHKADVGALNHDRETPLVVAFNCKNFNVVSCLICNYGCDPNVKNSQGYTPLHYACESGNIDLVLALIHENKTNLNDYSKLFGTPLNAAFRAGNYKLLLSLMGDHCCNSYMKDEYGKTVLHLACESGNIDVVNALLHTHKVDVNASNEHKETPVHVALASKQHKLVLALIKKHGCDITALDRNGWTLLHVACQQGAINVVYALINDMSDINVRTDKNATPLYLAALEGHYDVVLALVSDARCNTSAQDDKGRTALHVAALKGHYDVVLALVSDARCNISARDNKGRTSLHAAAYQKHHKIVQELLKYTSPLAVDCRGNTPLHVASEKWSVSTVQCLLHDNAPVLVRNAKGRTPRDLAYGECRGILEEYIKVNRKLLRDHYSTILRLAAKKYSGSHRITKLFVLGNPGAGKSSFIESLKREGFLESSVHPHTAGIIPSVHMSSQYGRVLFYDFAGDAEYYSSHAAIFEGLASSRKGDNIFIIVVDLREDSGTIKSTLHYWFSFIHYQMFDRPSFIVVGGHLDQSVKQSKHLDAFCTAMQPYVRSIKHFMLDCRDPRSSQIAQVKKRIFALIGESQKYELSREARLLLGLLEKDFSSVTACPVQTLVSHIKDCGGWLPVEPTSLHQILLELHEVGVLLLLGDCTKDSDQIVLNITNEVHQTLFAKSAFSNIQETHPNLSVNIGILPDSILKDVLPQYITKECLIHLQYCQEIFHIGVGLFPLHKQNDSTSQSFLFFPALCSEDKGQVPWDKSTGHCFSIRWLALCTNLHDYFPPRFLHVLLLRLVQRFTLSVPPEMVTTDASAEHSRRCTMWKKGVYWKMEEGVDCMVELVG